MSINQNGNAKPPGPIAQGLSLERPSNQKGSAQGQKKSITELLGFADKTPWDWISVLLVPLIIGVGTIYVTAQQSQISQQQYTHDQRIADNQQQDAILNAYEDNILQLFNQKLLESKQGDELRIVANSQTSDTLPRLDAKRKGLLIQFLYHLGLLNETGNIVDLYGDDLEQVDLSGLLLSGIDLRGAKMQYANLGGATFDEANLDNTLLNNADLNNIFLNGADMQYADLSGANLSNASLYSVNMNRVILKGANLTKAELQSASLLVGQLDTAFSLSDTLLPDGTQCLEAENMNDLQEQATIATACITQYQKSQWYHEQEFPSGNSQ